MLCKQQLFNQCVYKLLQYEYNDLQILLKNFEIRIRLVVPLTFTTLFCAAEKHKELHKFYYKEAHTHYIWLTEQHIQTNNTNIFDNKNKLCFYEKMKVNTFAILNHVLEDDFDTYIPLNKLQINRLYKIRRYKIVRTYYGPRLRVQFDNQTYSFLPTSFLKRIRKRKIDEQNQLVNNYLIYEGQENSKPFCFLNIRLIKK